MALRAFAIARHRHGCTAGDVGHIFVWLQTSHPPMPESVLIPDEEETVIQINNTGPWALGYIKSAHNPES